MINLEIIELIFCNLNKNTKRNIELRGIKEFSKDLFDDTSSNNDQININNEYYINTIENNSDKASNSMEILPKNEMI